MAQLVASRRPAGPAPAKRAAPAAVAVALSVLAAGCGLPGFLPFAKKAHHQPAVPARAGSTSQGRTRLPVAPRQPARPTIGEDARSARQVADAVAGFLTGQPSLRWLGCSQAGVRDVTPPNRNPAEAAAFPLLPELAQCGGLAVAVLPPGAAFGPLPFALSACAGSSGRPPLELPTVGGANWVLWPWAGTRYWMGTAGAQALAGRLGLNRALEPFTFDLGSRTARSPRSGAAPGSRCYALRGLSAPPPAPAAPAR
jgi:hypothetical protein